LLIDTGRLDADKPVDLAALCNTKAFFIEPSKGHFGINLTDEVSPYHGVVVSCGEEVLADLTLAATRFLLAGKKANV